jgi:hypothetical protein
MLVLSGKGHRKYVKPLNKKRCNPLLPGQQVQIEGRDEVFVVLRVDHARHLADLLRKCKVRKVETGIPLVLLRLVNQPGQEELQVPA